MADSRSRIGIFLDRDGTLIVEKNYLRDPAGVELLPDVIEGLKHLQGLGRLIVISNQSGVARGYMTEADVQSVNQRLDQLLKTEGIMIEAFYYAPHHPDFGETPAEKADWRKPGRGMIDAAIKDLGIDPACSFVAGDKETDLQLARNIGARAVLVQTGYGGSVDPSLADFVAVNLDQAAVWIEQIIKERLS